MKKLFEYEAAMRQLYDRLLWEPTMRRLWCDYEEWIWGGCEATTDYETTMRWDYEAIATSCCSVFHIFLVIVIKIKILIELEYQKCFKKNNLWKKLFEYEAAMGQERIMRRLWGDFEAYMRQIYWIYYFWVILI